MIIAATILSLSTPIILDIPPEPQRTLVARTYVTCKTDPVLKQYNWVWISYSGYRAEYVRQSTLAMRQLMFLPTNKPLASECILGETPGIVFYNFPEARLRTLFVNNLRYYYPKFVVVDSTTL